MGKAVEVGLMGKEGFVIVGFKTSPSRVIIQIAGSAYGSARARLPDIPAISAAPLGKAITAILRRCWRAQASQIAACNRLHEVDERLARWLLMSRDRIGSDLVPLTQEFLAHMLGTRRSSVTVAASILQSQNLVRYTRGQVSIVSPKGLEAASWRMLRRHWFQQSSRWDD